MFNIFINYFALFSPTWFYDISIEFRLLLWESDSNILRKSLHFIPQNLIFNSLRVLFYFNIKHNYFIPSSIWLLEILSFFIHLFSIKPLKSSFILFILQSIRLKNTIDPLLAIIYLIWLNQWCEKSFLSTFNI
jgi:hypothetical protein